MSLKVDYDLHGGRNDERNYVDESLAQACLYERAEVGLSTLQVHT